METKSAIAIVEGKTIRAIRCNTGDYVDLGPRLQDHWKDQEKVRGLIDQGYQQSISDTSNYPTERFEPAKKFFNLSDFMRHFENYFCEDYYIMDNDVWYYAGIGERSVQPLDVKLSSLRNPLNFDEFMSCKIHGHEH